MAIIKAKLGSNSHDILIGNGLGDALEKRLAKLARRGNIWVIYDATVFALYAQAFKKTVPTLKVGHRELVLPAGESAKSYANLAAVHSFLLSQRITRQDTIVAIGGGALTDLVGFAAATTMRGVNWVTIPTTLLGMVDAAIGGKTAINHSLGKNLVGVIWQPVLVSCDISTLMTLPERQLVSGLGEVIKYAGLMDGELTVFLTSFLRSGDIYKAASLQKLVVQSAKYKSSIVADDERETGLRMILNFGHTFGHGIERSLGYKKLTHGEAVIIGIMAALELSVRTKTATAKSLLAYRKLVSYALALIPKVAIDADSAVEAMAMDKKRNSHSLRFILLKKPGQPIIKDRISKTIYKAAMKAALAEYRSQSE